MSIKDSKLKRAARVQFMKMTSDLPNTELAATLGVSTKTIERDLRTELPPAVQHEIDEASSEFRQTFIAKAQPLALSLLDYIEERMNAGEMSARDATIATGVLTDKIRQLTPAGPRVETRKTLKITFRGPDGEDMKPLDGVKYADEPETTS